MTTPDTSRESVERMADLTRHIAEILDHPSVYMGGPSRQSLRKAEAIVAMLEAQRPAVPETLTALVERAFRDGLAYASVCDVTDPDEAWRTSAVRTALAKLRAE